MATTEPQAASPLAANWCGLIGLLVRCCESASSMAGHACVTEYSPGSESVYVHVRRRGVWYGIRISAHPPAYACSRDYASVVVPRRPNTQQVAGLARDIMRLVRFGGLVVADPAAVRRATRRLDEFLQAGSRYTDARGVQWFWSGREGWEQDRESATANPVVRSPRHRPRSLLNNRLRSAVRHSQNVLAKWSAELSTKTTSW